MSASVLLPCLPLPGPTLLCEPHKSRWILFSDQHGCSGDRPYFVSRNGNPCVNTATQGFKGPWNRNVLRGQLVVQPTGSSTDAALPRSTRDATEAAKKKDFRQRATAFYTVFNPEKLEQAKMDAVVAYFWNKQVSLPLAAARHSILLTVPLLHRDFTWHQQSQRALPLVRWDPQDEFNSECGQRYGQDLHTFATGTTSAAVALPVAAVAVALPVAPVTATIPGKNLGTAAPVAAPQQPQTSDSLNESLLPS